MSYPKNQVVKFDTPKVGLGLFKKHYLGRFLELKERAGSSMSTVSRLCSTPPLQPLLHSIVTSIKHRRSSSAIAPAYPSSRTWLVSAPRYLSLNSFASEDFVCPWMLMMIDTMVSLHCKMLELPARRDRVSRESAGNLGVLVCCVQSERTSDHFIEVA